jgi:hypothetical protein
MFLSTRRAFQFRHPIRHGLQFNIKRAQGRRVTSGSHFDRTRPAMKLGQQRGFNALKLRADPLPYLRR